MKLSSKLMYIGITVGGLAAIYILFQAMDLLLDNKPALIVLGAGALIYFIGAYKKRKGK